MTTLYISNQYYAKIYVITACYYNRQSIITYTNIVNILFIVYLKMKLIDSMDWVIDKTKKEELQLMIMKTAKNYYWYTSHWRIIDIAVKNTIIPIKYKWKDYHHTYSTKTIPWWVMWYDVPVVKQIDRKIENGVIYKYNHNQWE